MRCCRWRETPPGFVWTKTRGITLQELGVLAGSLRWKPHDSGDGGAIAPTNSSAVASGAAHRHAERHPEIGCPAQGSDTGSHCAIALTTPAWSKCRCLERARMNMGIDFGQIPIARGVLVEIKLTINQVCLCLNQEFDFGEVAVVQCPDQIGPLQWSRKPTQNAHREDG